MGVSRGGLTTKIHAVVDALGLPVRFLLSGGNRHDSQFSVALTAGLTSPCLLADKAYHAPDLRAQAAAQGTTLAIPPKVDSKNPIAIDFHRYKERHLVENAFQRLKSFRRVATRYDKLDRCFMGFVCLSALWEWLR